MNRTIGFQPSVHNTSFTFLEDQVFFIFILESVPCLTFSFSSGSRYPPSWYHEAWQVTRVRSFLDHANCPHGQQWDLDFLHLSCCAWTLNYVLSQVRLLQRKTGLNRVFGVHVIRACAAVTESDRATEEDALFNFCSNLCDNTMNNSHFPGLSGSRILTTACNCKFP